MKFWQMGQHGKVRQLFCLLYWIKKVGISFVITTGNEKMALRARKTRDNNF